MPAPTRPTSKSPVRQARPAKNSLPDPATNSTPTNDEETTHASHEDPGHRAGRAGDSAMTTAKSAYPASVADLLPKAHELTTRLGEMPSRNRLKAELRIGAPKANAILEELAESSGRPRGIRDEASADDGPSGSLGSEPVSATESEALRDAQTEPLSTIAAENPDPADSGGPSRVEDGPTTRSPEPTGPSVEQRTTVSDPVTASRPRSGSSPRAWPVLILALPAFVAIWSGWVGLGGLTGFGIVHPLPGIADEFALNTAITLPIGMETYAAYALRVWVSRHVPHRARRFARASALGSLALGALGQIVYHLMAAAHITSAPWPITTAVACLPVAVLGMGAALTHLLHTPDEDQEAPA